MTTNREWLYSLDVADLSDWFDAEHVENQERALDGDTEPENADSRELILTDLEKKTREWHDYDGNYMRIYSDVAYAQMKELLDRQAVITERKCRKPNWDYCETCETLAELTAERDELKERADYNIHGWAKANIGWAEANAEAEKWQMKCDEYRSKFGKCIDHADAIHALMDDEGMA